MTESTLEIRHKSELEKSRKAGWREGHKEATGELSPKIEVLENLLNKSQKSGDVLQNSLTNAAAMDQAVRSVNTAMTRERDRCISMIQGMAHMHGENSEARAILLNASRLITLSAPMIEGDANGES